MKQFLFLIFVTTFSISLFATIPPKKGVTPPPGFAEFQKMVSATYSEGYYAEKFRMREKLREDVANGLKPASALEQDTAFTVTLLGQYPDLGAHYPSEQFQQHLFDGPNPTGTIRDYYDEVSYSQLYIDGHCEGWYTVPGTLGDYVGTDDGLSSSGGPKFTLDLIKAADTTFNFADYIQYYDNQNKPHIGFIAVIHTGAGAEAGANNIWSHRWNFRMLTGGQPYKTNDIDPVSGENVLIDGDYSIEPELSGSSNSSGNIIEIGVFAHEFGHIFGLPDLYDTDGSSEGLGNWSLMAGGSWGGDGRSPELPAHMDAWCKKKLGWVVPINVTSYQENLSLPEVENNPVVYKLWTNGTGTTQYFLAENRQKTGFDVNLPNSGLLIYHVDENKTNNRDENHYLVDLEQADGKRDLNHGSGRGDAGDPFPGSTGNMNFDLDTSPNSKDYNLSDTYVFVKNIHRDSLNMVGNFDVGTIPIVDVDSVYLSETVFKDGRLGPGETGIINFVLHNVMPVNSDGTSVSFTINEPGIQINQSYISDHVPANTIKTVSIPQAIVVLPGFESRTIKIYYTVSFEHNTSRTDSVIVPVGIPEILLVSRAEIPTLSSYYTNSLTDLGHYYEVSYLNSPEYYSERKTIILFTGKTKTDIFSSDEIDSLTEFINNGGNVFLSGQNAAEYLETAYPDFLNNVIGITWDKSKNYLTHKIYGITGDQFGDLFQYINFFGGDGANNDLNADVISPGNDFHVSLSYKEDGTEPGAGWTIKPGGGKIFYLGFGFESINNDVSSITRNEVMNDILVWFTQPVGIVGDNETKVFTYDLEQNYPNPFNPSTRISYELAQPEFVTLKIYNMIGEEVSTLINEQKPAGRYTVQFNASALASGVYLYRLKAGNYISVRKMVVLK